MRKRVLVAGVVAAAAAAVSVRAQTVRTPRVGSAERNAILDAIRPSVESKFKVPIEFVVSKLSVSGNMALVIALPQPRGGGELPWQNFLSQDEYELGGVEVSAVVRKDAGRWTLVESGIGATDVWWVNMVPNRLL